MSEENKWMENLPQELVQVLEQLLPLPYLLAKYIEENKRLEAEIIILGNVLIKKGFISIEELEQMTKEVLSEKEKEMNQKLKDKPEILTRKEFIEIKSAIDELIAKKKVENGK